MTMRRWKRHLCAGLVAAALTVALTVSPIVAQVPQKALECNSGIMIAIGPEARVSGGFQCPVTLTITNGLSTDLFDNPVGQTFASVQFLPSCTNTPCVPDPALPVTYVPGSATNDCVDGMGNPLMPAITTNPLPPADVTFDYGMPGFTLAPSGGQCSISFDVFVPDSAGLGPFPVEALTDGVCLVTALTSSASGANDIVKVSTLGGFALVALALVLLFGAWRRLRARSLGQPAVL